MSCRRVPKDVAGLLAGSCHLKAFVNRVFPASLPSHNLLSASFTRNTPALPCTRAVVLTVLGVWFHRDVRTKQRALDSFFLA